MDILFFAELNEIKTIYNVLKAISLKEFGTVRILEEGLKVTVDELKCAQTSAYIPREVFTKYKLSADVSDDPVKFQINLKSFTECLNIFGDDNTPVLKIIYKAIGAPLSLVLTHSEENITADCEIQTMACDDSVEVNLAEECTLNNIVVNANQFVALLSELDASADTFELHTSPDAPYLQISTIGVTGESQIDVSKHSEMVVSFRCSTILSSKYVFSYIKQFLKVIALANKVSMSTSETGLLGLQLIIYTESEKQMYVEYYVTALLPDD